MFDNRNVSVFMQSKAQFFYVFHRGAVGTMSVHKICCIPADPEDADDEEQAVRVVEVKPVKAIRGRMKVGGASRRSSHQEDLLEFITIIMTTIFQEYIVVGRSPCKASASTPATLASTPRRATSTTSTSCI